MKMHLTLGSHLRCVIANLKLHGWALKASAEVKCQSPSEQGAQ